MKYFQERVSAQQRELERVLRELRAFDATKVTEGIKKMHRKIRAAARKGRKWRGGGGMGGEGGEGCGDSVREEGDGVEGEHWMKENRSLQMGVREQQMYHHSLEKKIAVENGKISFNLK